MIQPGSAYAGLAVFGVAASTMAALSAFASCLGGPFPVIGEIAARRLTPFTSCFGRFLAVIGKIAGVGLRSPALIAAITSSICISPS